MRRALRLAVLIAATAARAQASSTGTASFPLDQPEKPIEAAFQGEDRPLFGQTPHLRFIDRLPVGREADPAERQSVLRVIRYLRDFYRHEGLQLRVEERVFVENAAPPGLALTFAPFDAGPSGAAEFAPREALAAHPEEIVRAAGRLFGLKEPVSVAGLTEPETAVLRGRYAFPPPPAATDPFHRPAIKDYRATADDFKMFEHGLEDAAKVEGRLFPGLLARTYAVLYDTTNVYIYSFDHGYPFPKFKKWRGYQVYKLAHHSRPEEHEMWGCAGGLTVLDSDTRKEMGELFFACSPWGTFRVQQEKYRTVYRFPEGYWTSIIHEYGHQYQSMLAANPAPPMIEIEKKIGAMKLAEGVSAFSSVREGIAGFYELKGARLLYPEHYRRLVELAKRGEKDDDYGHYAGLAAALAVLKEEDAGRLPAAP